MTPEEFLSPDETAGQDETADQDDFLEEEQDLEDDSGDANLHERHRARLKTRFLKVGFDAFEPHEILELLLYYCVPRIDTNRLGHQLIRQFGTLSRVFDAPYEELEKVRGISSHSALLLKMVPELSRAYSTDKLRNVKQLTSYELAGEFFVSQFVGVTVEKVMLLCLDNNHRVLDCSILQDGTVNSSNISIRRIAEIALSRNASSVMIAHNHPNGIALPSSEDLNTTEAVAKAMELLEIHFLEHFIIAETKYLGILSKRTN